MPIKTAMRDTVTPTATSPPEAPEELAASAPDDGLYPPLRSGRSARMIGEVIVDLGYANRETVEQAVAAARAQGRPTGQVLV
jgi:hypothetical protein